MELRCPVLPIHLWIMLRAGFRVALRIAPPPPCGGEADLRPSVEGNTNTSATLTGLPEMIPKDHLIVALPYNCRLIVFEDYGMTVDRSNFEVQDFGQNFRQYYITQSPSSPAVIITWCG